MSARKKPEGEHKKNFLSIRNKTDRGSIDWFSSATFNKKKALDLKRKKLQKRARKLINNSFFLIILGCLFTFIGGFYWFATADKSALEKSISVIIADFTEGIDYARSRDYENAEQSFKNATAYIERMQVAVAPARPEPIGFGIKTADWGKGLDLLHQYSLLSERMIRLMPEIEAAPTVLQNGDGEAVLEIISKLEAEARVLKVLLQDSEEVLEQYRLPLKNTRFNERRARLLSTVLDAQKATDSFLEAALVIRTLLGMEGEHITAVFFQNSGEIRASGGFPGSMSIITAKDGVIDPQFYDIYYWGWKNTVVFPPPPGFERLVQRLFLRDANSFFHFPYSAKKMRELLLASTGPKAETIVVITDQLLAELLRSTGPIEVPGFDARLTHENVSLMMSFFVESKATGRHTPKDFIALLVPVVFEKAKQLSPIQMLEIWQKAVKQKMVLAHSNSLEVQQLIRNQRLSGEIRAANTADYLAVVSANVGGNKSDRFIRESLELVSVVALDGTVTNTLTINRFHEWGGKQEAFVKNMLDRFGEFYVDAATLRKILGAGDNHSYTQVFVPFGAELIDVDGVPVESVRIGNENVKTVFGFRYPKVPAGTRESVSLTYELNSKLSFPSRFNMYFQTQPGREETKIMRRIVPEAGITSTNGTTFRAEVDADALFVTELTK